MPRKNIIFSICAFVLAILILIAWSFLVPTSIESPNWIGLSLFMVAIIAGIFLAHKSNVAKESLWMGNFLIIIGIIIILFPLYAGFLAETLDKIVR